MMHKTQHPMAGQMVLVKFRGTKGHPQFGQGGNFVIEDWVDRVAGKSWKFSDGNITAMLYGIRSGFARLPLDDEVVYGKMGGLGLLVHESEIVK